MTEEKKSTNPFLAMAQEAKKKNAAHPGLSKAPKQQGPKANAKGFGGANVTRRAGRGG